MQNFHLCTEKLRTHRIAKFPVSKKNTSLVKYPNLVNFHSIHSLGKMIENGQVERIVKKWAQKPPACTGKTDDLILSLGQVRTPFAIIAVGLGLALATIFVEKMCSSHKFSL